MFDMSNPASLTSLEDAFLDVRAVQYGSVAGFVLCIYDYMLTVSDEVELYWVKRDYKITRVLYFMVRSPRNRWLPGFLS